MLHRTLGDPADLHAEQLQEWRDASKRVMRTYAAWCAADTRDRHLRYVSFLDALRREERAAEHLERASSALDGGESTPGNAGDAIGSYDPAIIDKRPGAQAKRAG